MKLLKFPSTEVQEEVSRVIRDTSLYCPTLLSQFSPSLLTLMDKQKSCLGLEENANEPPKLSNTDSIYTKAIANSISTLLTILRDRPLYLPYDTVERVWNLILKILSKLSIDPLIVGLQLEVSWSLLSGVICLEESFVIPYMESIITLWRNVFIAKSPTDHKIRSVEAERDWMFLLKTRDFAIHSICIFLHKCPRLINESLMEFILSCINGCFVFLSQKPSYVLYDTYCFESRLLHCFSVLSQSTLDRGNLPILAPIMNAIIESDSISTLFHLFINEKDIAILCSESSSYSFAPSLKSHQDLFSWFETSSVDSGHVCTKNRRSLRVDHALEIFTKIFIAQTEDYRCQLFVMLIEGVRKVKLGRKKTLQINCLTAILLCFSELSKRRGFLDSKLQASVIEFLESVVSHQDPSIRYAASCAYGFVASCMTIFLVENLINLKIQRISEEREAYKRAGCVLSLGNIMRRIFSASWSESFSKIIDSFQLAALDSNPIVFRSALLAMRTAMESTGGIDPSLSKNVFALIARFFISPYANDASPEVQTLLGQSISFLMRSTGPELQLTPKLIELCLCLCDDLQRSPFDGVKAAFMMCLRHFVLMNVQYINKTSFCYKTISALKSDDAHLCREALLCTRQLSLTMPLVMLEEPFRIDIALMEVLNCCTNPIILDETRQLLTFLIVSTVKQRPYQWLRFLLDMILRPHVLKIQLLDNQVAQFSLNQTHAQAQYLPDDDDSMQQISLSRTENLETASETPISDSTMESTISFALDSLQTILKEFRFDGFDLDQNKTALADLLRCAASISTTSSENLRLKGLSLLNRSVRYLNNLHDPDNPGSDVLEQYGAFVLSALSPAFSYESNPFILANACEICLAYIDSLITTSNPDLSKIARLLTQSLERLQGDLLFADMCPLVYDMMKQVILSSWAELYAKCHSFNNIFSKIFDQFLPVLSVLWLASLHSYAELRLVNESMGSLNDIDDAYLSEKRFRLSLAKVSLFNYYDVKWIGILEALMILSFYRVDLVNFALSSTSCTDKETYRNLYVVLGLCVEEIKQNNIEKTTRVEKCLKILQRLLDPLITGENGLEDEILLEILDSLYSLQIHCTNSVTSSAADLISSLYFQLKKHDSQKDSQQDSTPNFVMEKILNSILLLVLAFMKSKLPKSSVDPRIFH